MAWPDPCPWHDYGWRERALRAEAEVRALREAQGELLEALRPFTSTERYSITLIDGRGEIAP